MVRYWQRNVIRCADKIMVKSVNLRFDCFEVKFRFKIDVLPMTNDNLFCIAINNYRYVMMYLSYSPQ